jgi:hypothetical protein
MKESEREQANTIREHHLRVSEDHSELYCECEGCGQRVSVRIRALNKALHRLAAALDDEFGQRLLDFGTIYWYIEDAFAHHAVERKWRVLQGYLYCPNCMSTAK